MEADRLSVLGKQLTADKLAAQQEVVRNERRSEFENAPYGRTQLRLPELLFPVGHPYAHPVIGSHADIAAATVADVKTFFQRHYQPAAMAVIVAGDVQLATTEALIRRYFGQLTPGKKRQRVTPVKAARLTVEQRETITDDVNYPKITMAWLSPPAFKPGDAELDLLAAIAGYGKGSRLHKALVHDAKLAHTVVVQQESRMLRSVFTIEAIARNGVSLDALEKAIDVQLDHLRTTLVYPEELTRAKNRYETRFVTRLQSLQQRVTMLASYWAFNGEPDFVAEDLARYRRVSAQDLQRVAATTLNPDARVVLRTLPRTVSSPSVADEAGGRR